MCMRDYRGFGLVTRFTVHFNTRLMATIYSSLLHTQTNVLSLSQSPLVVCLVTVSNG
jgi:hypothetical protein